MKQPVAILRALFCTRCNLCHYVTLTELVLSDGEDDDSFESQAMKRKLARKRAQEMAAQAVSCRTGCP